MDNLPKVEIGVAAYGPQQSEWWQSIMMNLISEQRNTIDIVAITKSMSMLPDDNKNKIVDFSLTHMYGVKDRDHQTDVNRNKIAHWFMHPDQDTDTEKKKKAEWLVMIDTDTVPPPGFIKAMIDLKRPIVSGIYFLPKEPFTPIAYKRTTDGLYEPVVNYQPGELIEVDSIGMGCVLIHSSVFETIQKNHVVYQNQVTGEMIPVYKEHIVNTHKYSGTKKHTWVAGGLLNIPVREVNWDNEDHPWPFFALGYSRTEDHFFCELANNVGIKPFLDTTITCEHWKFKPTVEADYKGYKKAYNKHMAEMKGEK